VENGLDSPDESIMFHGMRRLVPLSLLALAGLVGCTTPCDESRRVLLRQCGIEVGADDAPPCEGQERAYAECIVDHPAAACDYFYDPIVAEGNAFDLCVRAIPLD
jgi:hypothetical protein